MIAYGAAVFALVSLFVAAVAVCVRKMKNEGQGAERKSREEKSKKEKKMKRVRKQRKTFIFGLIFFDWMRDSALSAYSSDIL